MPDVIGIDHVYLAVTDLPRAEAFHDLALVEVLGFRKNRFAIAGDAHVQYYNRHFGLVLRPARTTDAHDAYRAGLHHLCLRVETVEDVAETARALRARGIAATDAAAFPDYAPDYHATSFTDPDGIRFEVTNYRDERRARHDRWEET